MKPPTLTETWLRWKQYKKEQFRFTYKGTISEDAAFNLLMKLSGDNSTLAMQIIEQSIENGWRGLFPLKIDKKEPAKVYNPKKRELTPEEIRDREQVKIIYGAMKNKQPQENIIKRAGDRLKEWIGTK